MRIAFCGGGTGGHVYPALTVAAALRRRYAGIEPVELLYLGVRGRIDQQLVEREDIPFKAITAGPLRVGSLKGTALGGAKLTAGTAESLKALRSFRPDAIFATGGYGSVGVAFAARALRLPLILFEPGPESGLAVKLLSRAAGRIIVTIPPALEHMPKDRTSVIGYPVRPAFFEATREAARAKLGLHPELPTLLISGASSGASALNDSVTRWLANYLEGGQMIHLSGPRDEYWLNQVRAGLPGHLQTRYHLHAYLHDDMAHALAAADLAVMRSGASVLGELPATGLPAILIPGEYEGWDQSANARYLEEQGAAVMLRQGNIDQLYDRVQELMADQPRREAMRSALTGLARPYAAEEIADVIAATAGVKTEVAV